MGDLLSTDDAIRQLRSQPDSTAVIRDAYLDENTVAASERFEGSEEFAATLRLLGAGADLGHVLDLGAGTGIASRALARSGATRVTSVEPDPSPVVGLGCLVACVDGLPVHAVSAFGDGLPVRSSSVDVVYCRQVLHHIPSLDPTLVECARVLRPGGVLLAVREHVVDDDVQLAQFRAEHPVHQLAGGEGAHSLDTYVAAIEGSGLELRHVLGPWDSILNCYPDVARPQDIPSAPSILLGRRFGRVGAGIGALPGVRNVVWRRLRRPRPGRLYSFVARKPAASSEGSRSAS